MSIFIASPALLEYLLNLFITKFFKFNLFAFAIMAIIVIAHLMNDSIKTSDDVEKYLGLNVLGSIPLEEGTNKKATHGHDKDAMRAAKQRKRKQKKAQKYK